MNGSRNIVLFAPGFPKDEGDHLCMPYVQEFLKYMLKFHSNIRFRVIALQYPYQATEYKWNGIPVVGCGGNNNRFPGRLVTWRKALKTLERYHVAEKVSAIHSLWLNDCTYLAQRWSRKNHVRLIATAMGQDVQVGNRYLKRINMDRLTSISLSQWQNEELARSIGRTADHLIPWGFDAFPDSTKGRHIDILGVGSLTSLKNYDQFIETVKIIHNSHPDLKVVLIGYGPERDRLEARSAELGLSDIISFAGEMTRPEVLRHMQQAKVLLHPSRFESQGYVFNEALANGMAIVSRKVGIAEDSDRWVTANSGSEMSSAVKMLMTKQFEPIAICPMAETAESYLNLFQ